MSETKSYDSKSIFSQRNAVWARYDVKKPRLPNASELEEHSARWVDDPNNRPSTFSLFIGVHNLDLNRSLLKILEDFSDNKILPTLVLLHGAKGSGKTSMANILASEIVEEMEFSEVQASKWILILDAKLYLKDLISLFNVITKFADRNLERILSAITFRFVIIDNIDLINPTNQQGLRRLMEKFSENARFFIISGTIKGVISAIQSSALCLKSNQIKENDCLKILLHFCKKHNIGYEREGMILLLKIFPKRSLTDLLDLMQEVFTKRYFLSYENIMRIMKEREITMKEIEKEQKLKNSKLSKALRKIEEAKKVKSTAAEVQRDIPEISYLCVLQPIKRCKMCTLIPPCSHISEDDLYAESVDLRQKLPADETLGNCLEFIRYGKCNSYNKFERCKYNHPNNVHKIKNPVARCTICTLLWPCDICKYSQDRKSLVKCLESAQLKLSIVINLCSPEPSFSLTQHLEEITSDWLDIVKYYKETYCTSENNQILQENLIWANTSNCCVGKKYKFREKNIRDELNEILTSKLLEPRKNEREERYMKSNGKLASTSVVS